LGDDDTSGAMRRAFQGGRNAHLLGDDTPELESFRRHINSHLVAQVAGKDRSCYDRSLMLLAAEASLAPEGDERRELMSDTDLRRSILPGYYLLLESYRTLTALLWQYLENSYAGRVGHGCDPTGLGLALWHSTYAVPYFAGETVVYPYLSKTK